GDDDAGRTRTGGTRHDKARRRVGDPGRRGAPDDKAESNSRTGIAAIQRGGLRTVVRDRPGRGRARYQTPGVDEGRIYDVCLNRSVGHQVLLHVKPRGRWGRVGLKRERRRYGARTGTAVSRARERQRTE